MALTLVGRGARALAEQLNAYYRVLRGTDPDSVDLRLNGGGRFAVHHSGTNAVVFQVTDAGASGTIDVPAGSIGTSDLADNAVTSQKIAPNTIVAADIGVGAVTGSGLGAGGNLAAGAVGTADLADGAVTSQKIADGTIADADVAGSAGIGLAKLAHVGAGNVLKSSGSANVGGQVANADVAANAAIAYAKLALGASIVNADVSGSAAIALSKLAPGAAGVLKSNGSAISAGNLVATSDMAANTINGDRILDASIPSAKIIGGATIPADSIDSSHIVNGSIQAADIAPGALPALLYTTGHMASNTASVHYNPVSTAYRHLTIVVWGRSSAAGVSDALFVRLNLDTGNTYYAQMVVGSGAAAAGLEASLAATYPIVGYLPGASAAAGIFSAVRLDIPGYTSAAAGHSIIGTGGFSSGTATGNHSVRALYGYHHVSAAVTAVWVAPVTGPFVPGSIVSFFGWP